MASPGEARKVAHDDELHHGVTPQMVHHPAVGAVRKVLTSDAAFVEYRLRVKLQSLCLFAESAHFGKLFLEDRISCARLLTLSSRISYELVQKSARARIPVILAISRPTALAIDLAAALNMTLASLGKGESLMIYTHPRRLVWTD